MMLYWILLLGFITESIAKRFGIPYLFLDPEYRGHVGMSAYFIMGVCMGAFIMAFNISSFILNSFRFPFLATLSKTFLKYSHNNFIIPGSFILLYCYKIYVFQSSNQLKNASEIYLNLFMFLVGIGMVLFLTFRYFLYTNKDIYKLFGVEESDQEDLNPVTQLNTVRSRKTWRVDTYIQFPFKVKLVRDTRHYQKFMIERVFRQNHINAAVVEIIVFVTFIVLGLFRDNAYFRIPAGGSVMLLFTMFMMISGVFRYWLRAWANTALVLFFIGLNFISQFEMFNPRNQAYGINYSTKKSVYSKETLDAQVNDSIIQHDIQHTIQILERWKARQITNGDAKPKMILMNVSGGGLRSCVFTFRVLQLLDSTYHGEILHKTSFVSGSSGGLISLAYYRELFYRDFKTMIKADQDMNNSFLNNIGKDMLNSVTFTATVADIFLNVQQFNDGKYNYVKDRAYAWESQFQENTNHVLDKHLKDYYEPELKAEIPMMVICPTIINDGRGLYISSQPVSYLIQNSKAVNDKFQQTVGGVEFGRFFKDQDAGNLNMVSALRMNSAFPYIMPAVSLPSEPVMEVMDAGIRDNYGLINSIQFLHTFRDWIEKNTSGVVLLQIRDTHKKLKVEDNSNKNMVEKILSPLRNVSGNFIIMQDYAIDRQLEYVQSWLKAPIDYVLFQMPETQERVSLSWHLTEKEKKSLKLAALNKQNRSSLEKIKRIIAPE